MYRFNGIERLSYGFFTPNETGLMLLELLFLWLAISGALLCRWPQQRWLPVVLSLPGATCSYVLCLTLSRGAICAALSGLVWALVLIFVSGGSRKTGPAALRNLNRVLIVVLFCLIACIFISRAGDRLSPVHSASDASVLNRLEIWKTALPMLGGAPLSGWGSGHSPAIYNNWFADPESPILYVSLVSTFLNLSLDYGLVGLVGLLCTAGLYIYFPWRIARQGARLPRIDAVRSTGAALVGATGIAFILANLPSSFVGSPWFGLFPLVALTFLLGIEARAQGWMPLLLLLKRLVFYALGCGLLLTGSAVWMARQRIIIIEKASATRIALYHSAGGREQLRIRVLFDRAALGRAPGKVLRKWFMATPPGAVLEAEQYPFVTNKLLDCSRPPQKVTAFGSACSHAVKKSWAADLILVFPDCPPDDSWPVNKTTVYLPEIDELALNESWIDWARKHDFTTKIVCRSGREILPELFNPLCP